jgi:hypothetical protein
MASTVETRFGEYVMAMDRVARRLRRVAAALDAAGIPYAVVGGNAVSAWVATRDPAATRTTKDVDLLVNAADVEAITRVLAPVGFTRSDVRNLVILVDAEEPARRSGVHLIFTGSRVRPSNAHPAPELTEAVRSSEGFSVIGLEALLRMKLTSYRFQDCAHVADMLRVGLIDDDIRARLPQDLLERLRTIEQQQDPDEV